MRLEATIPDHRARAFLDLADDLGLSRSQMVDEAIALFLMAVGAVKRGHRLVSVGGAQERELTTPTLTAMELALTKGGTVELSPEAVERVRALLVEARQQGPRLRPRGQATPVNKIARP